MSSERKEFLGKDVAEAIKKACETLSVGQEKLEIEVVDTGSTGIFGLIRKKARIRVQVRQPDLEEEATFVQFAPTSDDKPDKILPEEDVALDGSVAVTEALLTDEDEEDEALLTVEPEGEASEVSLAVVREELLGVVQLMGFPSTVEIQAEGLAVSCTLRGEYEENLFGQDGKVLDSLQYILRKIVSRKISERLRITINVGAYREKRLTEIKTKALELAALVKEDGKTQVLPGLSPSERREVHMLFQDNKEVRSRSVGEGLFKKILIYKPGKNNRAGNGKKRSFGKGRSGRSSSKGTKES